MFVKSENFDMSEIKELIGLIRATVENCAFYAYKLITEGKLSEAKEYLNNAVEGIEILEG